MTLHLRFIIIYIPFFNTVTIKFNTVHCPCNSYIICKIFITNFYTMFLIVINYYSDMLRPQLLAIVREFVSVSMCANYVSNYVEETIIIAVQI